MGSGLPQRNAPAGLPPLGLPSLPPEWATVLAPHLPSDTLARLDAFLMAEHQAGQVVYPPPPQRFRALEHTPPERVKAVILGQDPYHGPGQAHGLAFSVPAGVRRPPSLRNILREAATDVGIPEPDSGCLDHWADQGVLLLNTALTVAAGQAGSHARQGWEAFTRAVLRTVDQGPNPVAFVLWGAHAQRHADELDPTRHLILRSAHPSPLSARTGFFGSRPFSRVNAFLAARGIEPIDWRLAPPR